MPILDFEKISEPSITTRTMKQLLLLRHSVRAYKDKEVQEGLVKDLIEVATHAGTGSNLQCLDFVVIKNSDVLAQLEKLTLETVWHTGLKLFDDKSIFADILSRKFGMELSGKYRNYHKEIKIRSENRDKKGMVFRGAPMVIVAHDLKENTMGSINAGIALRNIEITAQTMGLGCCWAGFFINAAQKRPGVFNRILGISGKRKVYGALMIGYPKYKVKYKLPRVSREVKII
jgi:nitroreductase